MPKSRTVLPSTPLADFAMHIARDAGARLMTLLPDAMAAKDIRFKGPTDLVTRADKEVEAMIAAAVRATFPDHGILAEEGTLVEAQGDYRWIVDPLDGTTNFAHGFPWFGVSIALEHRGQVELGVVYHPALQELFIAQRGAGAWLSGGGGEFQRLKVSDTERVESALLATGLPGRERRDDALQTIPRVLARCREVRLTGSAAIHLAYVAAGRLDGFWEPGLNLWDVAPGYLLVTEAGGQVTDLEGGSPRAGSTLATNGRIHRAVLELIRRH